MASEHGSQSTPMISNAVITNPTFMDVRGNAYFNTSDSRLEIEFLRSKVSAAALHNSGERHDAPRCHPGTRVGAQDDIMKWLNDVDDPQFVLWMNGSAGVGKSAIAQAIASLCYDCQPRRLAGGFFLSRSAPAESGRGDDKRLVATLAYQMAKNIPDLELNIANAVARNRLVFDLDLETQIKELILIPLTELSNETPSKIPAKIIVLDALDECAPTSSHARIIKAFVAAIANMQHKIPHKLLVASRPESNIQSVFETSEISPVVRSISLDTNYRVQEDIRKFLVDGFTRFRETHPSPAIFPPIWPTDDEINRLVWRSDDHFIYASTIQKYIQEDHANPVLRLQSILDVAKDPTDRPFAELDALYSYIFRQVKELETVLHIFFIIQCGTYRRQPTITFCESLLGLPKGGGPLVFQALSSVGKVDSDQFQAYHASLVDFLEDEHRAGDLYIYSDKICTHLCCLALEYIPSLLCCDDPDSVKMKLSLCFEIADKYIQQIKGPHTEIHKKISTFDLDQLFEFFRKMNYSRKPEDGHFFQVCSNLFEWLVKEHQNLAQSHNMILLPPFSQLQEWILGQLRFQFEKPASMQSLDYWDNIFLLRDAEMYLIQRGLATGSQWIVGSAPQALNEDRISQLMSRYCYYILNSSWLNIIRNPCLSLESDKISDWQGASELRIWFFLTWHGPLQINQYLDIQYILGLNSSINTAASRKDFRELLYLAFMLDLISDLYQYLLRVEEEFSCLTSPLNELEDSTTAAEEHAINRQSLLPYVPHPSDSPLFMLALTLHKIRRIEYRDTELGLPVV